MARIRKQSNKRKTNYIGEIMKTAKEKAIQLLSEMTKAKNVSLEVARYCALIFVKEILENVIQGYHSNDYGTYDYWEKVKYEIETIDYV